MTRKARIINVIVIGWLIIAFIAVPLLFYFHYQKAAKYAKRYYILGAQQTCNKTAHSIAEAMQALTETVNYLANTAGQLPSDATYGQMFPGLSDIYFQRYHQLSELAFWLPGRGGAPDRYGSIKHYGDSMHQQFHRDPFEESVDPAALSQDGDFFVNVNGDSGAVIYMCPVYRSDIQIGWIKGAVDKSFFLLQIAAAYKESHGEFFIIDDLGMLLNFEEPRFNIYDVLDDVEDMESRVRLSSGRHFTTFYRDPHTGEGFDIIAEPINTGVKTKKWWAIIRSNTRDLSFDEYMILRLILRDSILIALFFLITAAIVGYLLYKVLSVNKDLTFSLYRLKKTQRELINKEKMASLGSLVKGISHELNTPIGVSYTAVSYLKNDLNGIKPEHCPSEVVEKLQNFREATDIISTNLDRSISLLKGFREIVYDTDPGDFDYVTISEVFSNIAAINYELMKDQKHTIQVSCDQRLSVMTYQSLLIKILSLLLRNSVDHGFPDGREGTVKIEGYIDGRNNFVITYADDGVGIPDEYVKKIFDPFFTTTRGKGSVGLGLTVVHTIVTNLLHGTIVCSSIRERGTLFIIKIPDAIYRLDL